MKLEIFAIIASLAAISVCKPLLIYKPEKNHHHHLDSVIASFVKSSPSDKTISVITFDNSTPFNFPASRPRMLFNVAPRALDNCTNYANIDFYDDAATPRAFSHGNLTLIAMLARMEFNDFIIVVASSSLLESVLRCMVQPQPRFLLIINEAPPSLSHLAAMLNRTWLENGAAKIFVASHDDGGSGDVFKFDPFHENGDGSYGKLNSFTAVPFESETKQLNGYPLRVEIFTSTYTLARTKQPLSVDDFDGPDVDVARTTSQILNATSES
jgi:hypothetical protein